MLDFLILKQIGQIILIKLSIILQIWIEQNMSGSN